VKAANAPRKSSSMLGIGLDADDGQVRLTRGKNYALVGGSEQTHTVMWETAEKINEHVDREGKRLEDLTANQLREICQEVSESLGR